MTEQEIRARLREFVGRFFRGHDLADGEDIFATGFVNSMFAMQLVQFVEQAFGITCESEDLELDNFRSIDALAAFVQRKLAVAA
jgi:acyl carrier protein